MTRAAATTARLTALQQALRDQNLDGFFVPRTDFWQGEEVMPCDERLAWLFGFTGSAGLALVLKDRAALFVDGRYTLQAATELAGTGVEIRHVSDAPWHEWLGNKQGLKIGFDPRLSTRRWAEQVEARLAQHGNRLVRVEQNPVDVVWTDRPAPDFKPAEIFPLELAGEDSLAKRQRLGQELAARGFARACITDPTGIAWLLNIRGRDYEHTPVALSVLWLAQDGTGIWFTDLARGTSEIRTHLGASIVIQSPAAFEKLASQWQGQSVWLDELTASDWMYGKLVAAGATVKLDRCITSVKSNKNPVEVEGMKAAHRRDGVALANFLSWFAAHVAGGTGQATESAIMAQLAEARGSANNYRGPSFSTICGFAGSGAIVHYHTTPASDAVVAGNSLLLLDSGGQYVDGTTDVTRTMAVGTPTEEQRRNYTLVLQGHVALAQARFPVGTSGHQLDALARMPLWRAGLNFDHGTGHGVGHYLSVHEGPQSIASRPSVPLVAGMVLSNEPGYYKTGNYGIRIENLIVVQEAPDGEDGRKFLEFDTLTLAPYDRRLIVTDMLTADERQWIDAYHARVLAEVGPALDASGQAWLQQACAPLS